MPDFMSSSSPRNSPEIYQSYLVGAVTPRLNFVVPLPVVIEATATRTVIADEIFMRYGAGETAREALAAYLADFEQFVRILEQTADEFPEDARLLQTLYIYLGMGQ